MHVDELHFKTDSVFCSFVKYVYVICCGVVTPGTGKTLTGVKLVYWFVQMNKEHGRSGGVRRQTLYCGPSNSSVDVAASK